MDAKKPPGWFGRHWKWLVPSGCLVLLGIAALFVIGILTLVFGFLKASDPYKDGVGWAASDSRVIEQLGEPVETGYLVTGNLNINGGEGSVNLVIPLSGPKGAGTLTVVGTKSGGTWTYSRMAVVVGVDPETAVTITPDDGDAPR